MKKLLVAAIGAAVAFGAFADQISQQRFKNVATGSVAKENLASVLNTAATPSGSYWSDPADITNEYTVSAVASIPYTKPFDDMPGQALDIKTKFGKPLSVNIIDDGATTNIPNSGLYFDSLVKFTVCDTEPDQTYTGAKIIMWLQESDTDVQPVTTNLYVRAGYLSLNGNTVVSTPTNYVCAMPGNFDINRLNRVTIKAIKDITSTERGVPGFAIYINQNNGTEATTDINSLAAKWDSSFPEGELTEAASVINGGSALFPTLDLTVAPNTLQSVAFDGTGSITDIRFTDVAPTFAEDPAAPEVSGVVVDGKAQTDIKTLAAAVEAANGATASAKITLNKSFTIAESLAFTANAEITLDFAGFVLTNELAVAAITNSAAALIITNSVGKGGINCTSTGGAIYQTAATFDAGTVYSTLAITDGRFWGQDAMPIDVAGEYAGNRQIISGGRFEIAPEDYLVEGKAFAEDADEDGLYAVVEAAPAPTTHTVTVELPGLGSHVNVAVVVNGEPIDPEASYEVEEGGSVTVTYTADAGYVLTSGTAEYVFTDIDEDKETMAPTAEAATYGITYYNGETPLDLAPATYTYGVGVAELPSASADTGYQFDGWYDNAGLTGDPVTSIATTATGAKTLYAKFSGKTFTIKTYVIGTVGENATTNFTYAGVAVNPAAPSFDTETKEWNGAWYTDSEKTAAFVFDPAGAAEQSAYVELTNKGGELPNIPAGGEAECGTAEAAAAAADAINKDAASKAAHITVPAGVSDATTYLTYVEAKAVGTKVTVDFTTAGAAAAQTSANTDVEALPVAAAAADDTKATVSTVAGFYYSIVSGTTPTTVTSEGTRVLGNGGTIELDVPNKGPAGFYKVKVSARSAD